MATEAHDPGGSPAEVVAAVRKVTGSADVRLEAYRTRLGRELTVAKYLSGGAPTDPVEVRRAAAAAGVPPARYLPVADLDDPVGLGDPRPPTATVYRVPVTEVECTVVDIWADVLRLEEVGLDDDVYEFGADSLSTVEAVVQLSSALSASYRGAVPFELAILGARTPTAIVAAVEHRPSPS